ncbi:MAG: DUF177 domain-containing protein [Candidatus Aminicenantes bacterium]
MIINIDRLPEDGLDIRKDFEFFNSELVEEDAVLIEPVQAEVSARRLGEELLIKGRIQTRISFICCRCLSSYEFHVDSAFNLVYLPEELEEIKEQLEDEDLNKLFYYSREIDLKDVVLEQLNLTFPVRPLCSKDCRGICPVCGQVVDEGHCSCAVDQTDPRLDKLKNFLKDKRENG